jgi:hypothetical protein
MKLSFFVLVCTQCKTTVLNSYLLVRFLFIIMFKHARLWIFKLLKEQSDVV